MNDAEFEWVQRSSSAFMQRFRCIILGFASFPGYLARVAGQIHDEALDKGHYRLVAAAFVGWVFGFTPWVEVLAVTRSHPWSLALLLCSICLLGFSFMAVVAIALMWDASEMIKEMRYANRVRMESMVVEPTRAEMARVVAESSVDEIADWFGFTGGGESDLLMIEKVRRILSEVEAEYPGSVGSVSDG